MKVLLSWLREFAPIEGEPDQIAAQLTELGMELESVAAARRGPRRHRRGPGAGGAGAPRRRPDPPRRRRRSVTATPLQICCGASNMVAGDLVPLATIGTVMPGGMEIARAQDARPGEQRHALLGQGDGAGRRPRRHPGPARRARARDPDHRGARHRRSDVVYEFDALPNRPDTLSVLGVARDLAAHQGVPFARAAVRPGRVGCGRGRSCARSWIDAPDLCGRFLARVLSGVAAGSVAALDGPAPDRRGHAADQQRGGRLQLRDARARPAEPHLRPGQGARWGCSAPAGRATARSLETLDGVERTLPADDGVIVDARRPGHRHRRGDGRGLDRDLRDHHRRACSSWPGGTRRRSRPRRRG